MAKLTSQTCLVFLLYVTFCPIAALSSPRGFSKTFTAEKSAAFSPRSWSLLPVVTTHKQHDNWLLKLRGGQQQQQMAMDDDNSNTSADVSATAAAAVVEEESVDVGGNLEEEVGVMTQQEEEEVIAAVETIELSKEETVALNKDVTAFLTPIAGFAKQFGAAYAASLGARPIITKSVTACFIFALSDYVAQRLETKDDGAEAEEENDTKKRVWSIKGKEEVVKPTYNYVRTFTSAAVGLLYFGPAAHTWYETIFRIFTSTNIVSTLQKAALGQLLFGPSFTCVFFATSLLQAGEFTFGNWFRKIRNDLPGAWAAGLGFWPLVDVISFTFIPSQWIPLFVNFCSFIWTIYLSLVANRSTKANKN